MTVSKDFKHGERAYVCHTFYHVFITILKELNLPESERGKADILLSKMSNDFGDIGVRLEKSGLFKNVVEFDEKRDTFFPELMELKKDRGSSFKNMFFRIIYTRKYAKLEEPYIPVDFRKYKDIYVFCDSDPIGTYLNQKRIRYHAVEDGLNYLKPLILAKYNNRDHFEIKKFFSMTLNLIFICDGYSKYCIDMEVNDISVVDDEFYKYKEVPREGLLKALTPEARKKMIEIFVRDMDSINEFMKGNHSCGTLILTEPLCELDVREKLFRDLTDEYSKDGPVFIKPHPRDLLDYNKLFSEFWIFDKTIPMEVLLMFDEIRFKRVVSVYTPLDMFDIADEKILLDDDFMDKYEDPAIHRKADAVKEAFDKEK